MDDAARLQELDRTAKRFGEAWAAGDKAPLDALLSPGYTHTDVFGAFHDRGSWLAYATGRAGRQTRIAFRDVRTRLVGDVAIVTGINQIGGPGVRDAGDSDDLTIRFTQVWIWRDGRWLRECFQATPVTTTVAA